MQSARALILPSLWYAGGLPLVAIEALSTGLPIVCANVANFASNLNPAMSVLYEPEDPQGLAEALSALHRSPELPRMRLAARQEYLDRYTPEANYTALNRIYEAAIKVVKAEAKGSRSGERRSPRRSSERIDRYVENDMPVWRD